MPFSPIEQRWLDYCWSVLTDRQHIEQCKQAGGTGLEDSSLRWPGYLGSEYRPGGLLLIANIHRDFASGQAGPGLATSLVSSTRSWRDGGRSEEADQRYLSAVRHCYLQGLRQWTVGSWFAKCLASFGESFEHVAYVNAARCQAMSGARQDLQRLCLGRFPIEQLAEMLEPRLVLTCSTVVRDVGVKDTRVLWFHQRYGTDREGRRFAEWSQAEFQG